MADCPLCSSSMEAAGLQRAGEGCTGFTAVGQSVRLGLILPHPAWGGVQLPWAVPGTQGQLLCPARGQLQDTRGRGSNKGTWE